MKFRLKRNDALVLKRDEIKCMDWLTIWKSYNVRCFVLVWIIVYNIYSAEYTRFVCEFFQCNKVSMSFVGCWFVHPWSRTEIVEEFRSHLFLRNNLRFRLVHVWKHLWFVYHEEKSNWTRHAVDLCKVSHMVVIHVRSVIW